MDMSTLCYLTRTTITFANLQQFLSTTGAMELLRKSQMRSLSGCKFKSWDVWILLESNCFILQMLEHDFQHGWVFHVTARLDQVLTIAPFVAVGPRFATERKMRREIKLDYILVFSWIFLLLHFRLEPTPFLNIGDIYNTRAMMAKVHPAAEMDHIFHSKIATDRCIVATARI